MLKKLLTIAILASSFAVSAESTAKQKMEGTIAKPREVQTRDQYRIHMGLGLGFYSPSGDTESSPEYSLNIGFQPYIPFGVGLELTTTELDNTDTQVTSTLARATYNFAGDVPVLKNTYFGVISGPTFVEDGDVEFSVGPVAGFDIPLGEQQHDYMTLGLQSKYLYTTDIQDSFSAGLALKYWF